MTITVSQYHTALDELEKMIPFINQDGIHPAIKRHFDAAIELLTPPAEGGWREVEPQPIRDHLLIVRELMGDEYDSLPAPDKLIRHCDTALKAIPGEGEQSQAPYE